MKPDCLSPEQWSAAISMMSNGLRPLARRMGRGFLCCGNCRRAGAGRHRRPLKWPPKRNTRRDRGLQRGILIPAMGWDVYAHEEPGSDQLKIVAGYCEEGNAHLIAVAPELLEALKDIRPNLTWAVGKKIDALIAKAEGGVG